MFLDFQASMVLCSLNLTLICNRAACDVEV